uniref:PB2 n=1 Tax=Guadeloupe mosquito quaranja-like virus 3 TaxID=2607739 RepID=A0A5C1K3N9_9ORTO|nr:PB2 [Guadeloupe mosquito quaranja-like virus 3]
MESNVYPREVIMRWGIEGEHWGRESWYRREISLRHDMVCILLSNLEKVQMTDQAEIAASGGIPKRQRVGESHIGTVASGSSDSTGGVISIFDEGVDLSDLAAGNVASFRYILLEGMPSVARMINSICSHHAIPIPSRVYDIFDAALRQWIEVKVTKNYPRSVAEFRENKETQINSCLVHLDPSTGAISYFGRLERMPGEGKAQSFLINRKQQLGNLIGDSEPDLFEEHDLMENIFRSLRFNASVDKWVESWWSKRLDEKLEPPTHFPDDMQFRVFKFREMAEWIEDTTLRTTCEEMKFNGKILPPEMTTAVPTEKELDSEIIEEFLEGIAILPTDEWNEMFHEIIEAWRAKGENSHFGVTTKRECIARWPMLAKGLGIGRKDTVRSDHNSILRQDEYKGDEKLRYSPWMAHLLVTAAKPHTKGVSFFSDLAVIERKSEHPFARQAQRIRRSFYQMFGGSSIGEYCSLLKNFYSRMGGAYFEHCENGNHGKIMYFPIYSTGIDPVSEVRRRFVSGLCIRGPHHAKSATDRISFITIERMNMSPMGQAWFGVIKKAHRIVTINGKHFILRQNSICKQDPSFLAFVQNSTYLAANFVGEIVLASQEVERERKSDVVAHNLLLRHSDWMMERVSESVFMAVLGKSQEEGAFAIIRKIYMAALATWRGDRPLCRDWKGLAEALNECTSGSPLALYWGKKIRDLLLALSRN